MNPLVHYEKYGWKEGRDPGPDFSTDYYLYHHPESAAKDTSPLLHYLKAGRFKAARTLPKKRILVVAHHCPSRGHAGGLRMLDIYARVRALEPDTFIELFTQKNPLIDWNYDLTNQVFHKVIETSNYDLSFRTFERLRRRPYCFDVIDFEFLQPSENVAAFRDIGQKLLFTPMECLSRAFTLRSGPGQLSEAEIAEQDRIAAEEQAVSRLVDEVICVSEPDAEFLRSKCDLSNVYTLESGVSDFEFKNVDRLQESSAHEPFTVLFVAYFGSMTNVEALEWYLNEVHPLVKAKIPHYRFDVVGRGDLSHFQDITDSSVRLIGEVPEIAPHIARAAVGIAPALSGAGFRGKINQYAVLSVPTVASPIAAQSFAYENGVDILVGSTGEEFASCIISLLEDPELRKNMGKLAKEKCIALYSWASREPELRRIYELGERPDDGLPTVHAIVPSYRHGPFLERRISSIINQTYPKIELTVIDDCSHDNSDEIIRSLQRKHNFRYFRRDKNSGTPFSAWEFAAENFHDGLIWICESDDFAEPEFIQRGVDQFLANSSLVLFYSNSWIVDVNDARIGSTTSYFGDVWQDARWTKPFVVEGSAELFDYQYRGMTVPNMSSALMDCKAFSSSFNPFAKRFKLAGDWLFVGELVRHGFVSFTPDHLSNFRWHDNTARASVHIARDQAEHILTKRRLHLLSGKPISDLAETLAIDGVRFLHEKATAFEVVAAMWRVSSWDTICLLAQLGCSLLLKRHILREFRSRRRQLRLGNI